MKEKPSKKLDVVRLNYKGIPVMGKNIMPDGEVWFVNCKKSLVKKFQADLKEQNI